MLGVSHHFQRAAARPRTKTACWFMLTDSRHASPPPPPHTVLHIRDGEPHTPAAQQPPPPRLRRRSDTCVRLLHFLLALTHILRHT